MVAKVSYFEGLSRVCDALCKACGLEADHIRRLTFTIDFDGNMPTLEVEQVVVDADRMMKLAELLEESEDVEILRRCGSIEQTAYELTEHCGDYWRRATFETYEELCEHLKHRREPDATDTKSDS